MKAVVFHDIGDIRLDDRTEPQIKEPTNAIVRLTASAICGAEQSRLGMARSLGAEVIDFSQEDPVERFIV